MEGSQSVQRSSLIIFLLSAEVWVGESSWRRITPGNIYHVVDFRSQISVDGIEELTYSFFEIFSLYSSFFFMVSPSFAVDKCIDNSQKKIIASLTS